MEVCDCNEEMINITQESLEESESYFQKKSEENPFISIDDNNFSKDNTDAINAQFYKDSLNDIPKPIKINKNEKGRFDINSLPKCQLPIKIDYSANINNMINDGRKVLQNIVKPHEQKSVIANQNHDLKQLALAKSKLNWYGVEIPLEIRLTHINTVTQGLTHIIFPIKLVNTDEKETFCNTKENFSNLISSYIISKIGNEITNLTKSDLVSKIGNEVDNLSKSDIVSKIGNEINNLSNIGNLTKSDIVSKIGNEIDNLSKSDIVSKIGNEITNLSKSDIASKLRNEIDNLSKSDIVSKIGNEITNLSKSDIISKIGNEITNLSNIGNLTKSDIVSKIGNEINNLSKSDVAFKIGNEIRNLLKSDISTKIGNEIRKLSPSEVVDKVKEIDNKLPNIELDKLDLKSIITTNNVNLEGLNKKLENMNFNEIATKFNNQKFSLNDINSLLNLNTLVENTENIPTYNCCAPNYGNVVNINNSYGFQLFY
jgi:hypothetical protein